MSFSVSRDEVTLGNYRIGKTLGEGTFGKVKLGTHIATEQKVAVKILEKEKIVEQADMERVTREICILKTLRHPNIIQLYEIIQTKKDIYLIMEYADGGELFEYIVKKKRIEDKETVGFMQQILAGVDYMHRNGVVHRDLKPENLLLDHNKNIKIVDFGLSNQYKPGEKLKTACGSPCYAAPQMIAGKHYQCLNVDIWSCGVIMYALLCGYLPFQDQNTNRLYKKILAGQFDVPKFITPEAKQLMKKILNVDPQTRFKIPQIKQSRWYNLVREKSDLSQGIIVGKDPIQIDETVFKELENYNIDLKQARNNLLCNRHNPITSIYYLLVQKLKREGTLGQIRRSESPIVYRPDKYDDKTKTDRDYLASRRKKIEMPESTKNDSMNASNIISSLIEANKNNNNKIIAGLKNKKMYSPGDVNFDKVEENKQFPQKEVSQISDRPDLNSVNLTSRETSTKTDLSNARQDITGRASIGAPAIDRTKRVHQQRISLNDNQPRPNGSLSSNSKKDQHPNYSRKNQLSDQLKEISLKIDKEIQQLKKQNDSYISSQYTDRREPTGFTPTSITPGNPNRKKISLDVNVIKREANTERIKSSKVYEGMNSFIGPYNPRCVFGSNPRIVYQKILAFLESNGILYTQLQRFTIEVERRSKISLELLQNIQNVYIVTFSEKSIINEKLMNFLEL